MALHKRFRTHTLTVERITRTSDGAGGWTEAFASIGNVTGSLQPLGVAETSAADQQRAEARWVFYVDPDEDIARGDELVDVVDHRWRVLAVGAWDAASTIDHIRVDLEEVQSGR